MDEKIDTTKKNRRRKKRSNKRNKKQINESMKKPLPADTLTGEEADTVTKGETDAVTKEETDVITKEAAESVAEAALESVSEEITVNESSEEINEEETEKVEEIEEVEEIESAKEPEAETEPAEDTENAPETESGDEQDKADRDFAFEETLKQGQKIEEREPIELDEEEEIPKVGEVYIEKDTPKNSTEEKHKRPVTVGQEEKARERKSSKERAKRTRSSQGKGKHRPSFAADQEEKKGTNSRSIRQTKAPQRENIGKKNPEVTDSVRREIRHKRRVRNQILAFGSLLLFIVLIAALFIFLGHTISKTLAKSIHEEDSAPKESIETQVETESEESAEQTVETYSEDDLLKDMVDAGIADMSVEEMVGQLFLTTPEALTGTAGVTKAGEATSTTLAQISVSGLVYAPSNVVTEEQFSGMLSDTIGMSKFPLFLILDGSSGTLTQDLSNYGVNMEFAERMEEDPTEAAFRTIPLASLGGGQDGEGIVTIQLKDGQQDIGQACLDAWKNGADLLYVTSDLAGAYQGLLQKVQEDSSLEDALKESMARIYAIKYKNRLEN